MRFDHHECNPRRARTYAAGTLRRYQRPRHRADRRGRRDQKPRQAHPRRTRITGLNRRRSVVQRGARHRQDALRLQVAAQDFDRVKPVLSTQYSAPSTQYPEQRQRGTSLIRGKGTGYWRLGPDAMDVLGRYRNLIVLVGVLFAQVLGLAVQVKRTTDSEPTRLIRIWAVGTVTPLEKALVWVQTSSSKVWHNYFYLRGVRAENRGLKAQIERMSLEQVRMSQDADQARRLQALLAFKEQFISRTMAAQVIGSSG